MNSPDSWPACAVRRSSSIRSMPATSSGRRHDVPQLERTLVLAERLDECARAGGRLARLDRANRGRAAARGPRTSGVRSRPGARPPRPRHGAGRLRLLEMLGNRHVEPPALARQDGLGRSLGRQRVAELVALHDGALVDDEELGGDRLLERFVQLALGTCRTAGRAGRGRPCGRPPPPRRAAAASTPTRGRGGPGSTSRSVSGRPRPSDARGDELLGEERVAFGALVDRRDQARPGRMPEDRAELAGDLATLEPSQLDPLDAGSAIRLGEPEEQRVAPRQLVAAERDEQQQTLRLGIADQERQELPCRVVGPVQVLDREHDRSVGGEPPEQVEEGLVDPAARPLGSQLRARGRGDRISVNIPSAAPTRGQRPARHAVGRLAVAGRPSPRARGRTAAGPRRSARTAASPPRARCNRRAGRPRRLRAPRSRAAASTRDLPIPASPPSRTVRARPRSASRSASRAPARARCSRPISSGLAIRPAMASIIRCSSPIARARRTGREGVPAGLVLAVIGVGQMALVGAGRPLPRLGRCWSTAEKLQPRSVLCRPRWPREPAARQPPRRGARRSSVRSDRG